MLGGFVAYVVATQLGTHFFVGFFAAMVVMGLLSIVLENAVFRFLQRRPLTDQLLASLGLYMVLGTTALRIWGDFEARPIAMPGEDWALTAGDIRIDGARLVTIAITLVLFALLYFVVYRTHLGRTMRATAQGEETAALMGIKKRRVAAIVFFLGGALGGAAGAMLGALFNVRPDMGFQPLLMALVIIIFGGMGSIAGSIVAGLILGILYNLTVLLRRLEARRPGALPGASRHPDDPPARALRPAGSQRMTLLQARQLSLKDRRTRAVIGWLILLAFLGILWATVDNNYHLRLLVARARR